MIEDVFIQAFMAEYMGMPDSSQRHANAAIWGRVLQEVPTEMIEPMFYEAIATDPSRSPKPRDILAAFQGHLSPAYHEPAPQLPALPEGMSVRKAPQFVQKFFAHGAVSCHCEGDRFSPHMTARLMTTEELNEARRDYAERGTLLWAGQRYWVCAKGRCDFICEADALPAADGEMVGPLASTLDDVFDDEAGDAPPE